MNSFSRLGFVSALCLSAVGISPSFCSAEVLITKDEAQLPPPKGAVAVASRGITRGPRIALVSQASGIHSPMHLQLKFESFGGSKVVVDSVKVTYLKSPSVDLTARVKPFVQLTGIDMPNAELPPGEHNMRVDLQDSDGRSATSAFVLTVAP